VFVLILSKGEVKVNQQKETKKKEYTISDIANIAGVSQRTVSRVINREEKVSKKTREKINRIINTTGYKVNFVARSLRKKSTGILIVFLEKNTNNYMGSFTNVFINILNEKANNFGYKLIVSKSSAYKVEENEHDGFYLLKHGLADGAFIFDTREVDMRIDYLINSDISFVIIGRDNVYDSTSFVNLDNFKVGYIGANHLIKRGKKSILFFLGEKNFTVSQDRAKGFLQAIKEHHIPTELVKIEYGIRSPQMAYQRMKLILDEGIPDAVFVSGDERTIGVYHAIQERKLHIPRDIAVLGIDNILISEYYCPPLSTIDHSIDMMSDWAMKILNEQLRNLNNQTRQRKIFQPKLIIRDST
jgi:LacI family transcriptional regulator